MKLIQLARAKMMLSHAFFASLLMSLDMVETDTVPTMGTDMKRIYVNLKFVEEELATVPRVLFVLAHEVMHVALEHGLRVGQRNPMLWNIACITEDSLVMLANGVEVPASSIRVGQYLWSPHGPSQVLEVLDRGEKEVFQLQHKDGECFVTGDHRFLTDEGFSNADAKDTGLRQDIYAVSRSERLHLSQLQDNVASGHDDSHQGGVSQRGAVYVHSKPDGGQVHGQAQKRAAAGSVEHARDGLCGRDSGRRGDHNGSDARHLLEAGCDDQQHIVPAAGLVHHEGVHRAHGAEQRRPLVLENIVGWVRSGHTPDSNASVLSDQGASRRSAVGVHHATTSSVEARAADGSYARDCRNLSLVERADVDVRRTGETRRVLDFVTEHHVYAVGGLVCHNCDFAINLVLEEAGFEYPGNGCLDHKYKGMSADQIYDSLQKQADKERAKGNSGKPGEGGMPGLDKLHGPDGDLMAPEGGNNPAEEAKTRRQIQQKVAQAAQMARMAGQLSGELERLVGEILDPKVPWQDLLRDYVTRVTKDDESWGRRNRRFQTVYLPTRHSERMGEIVLIGDTSGSIGGPELQQYASEVNGIIEQVRPERVRILWADTTVAGEQVFEEGDKFDPKPQGGGGTDMRVPLKHAEQFEPEVVILFTDGYTPWPEVEPGYCLIVCCTTDAACPVGMVVRI